MAFNPVHNTSDDSTAHNPTQVQTTDRLAGRSKALMSLAIVTLGIGAVFLYTMFSHHYPASDGAIKPFGIILSLAILAIGLFMLLERASKLRRLLITLKVYLGFVVFCGIGFVVSADFFSLIGAVLYGLLIIYVIRDLADIRA